MSASAVVVADAPASQQGVTLGFNNHTDLTGVYYTGKKDQGEFDAVDQYPGKVGDGWSTPWEVDSNASSVRNTRVRAQPPLAEGQGSYVQFESQDPAGGPTNRQVYHTRGYEAHNGFDPTRPHTVTFLYRPDDTNAFAAGGATYLEVADAEKRQGGARTWMLRSVGTERKYWAAWDGKKDGQFNQDHAVKSKLEIVAGHTYQFRIEVDPAQRSYTAHITDTNTGEAFASKTLGFFSDRPNCGRLMFGVQLGNTDPENATTTYTFSLDSIALRPAATPK
jgi:hypothetical protein